MVAVLFICGSCFYLSSFIFLARSSLAAGIQVKNKLFATTPSSRINAQIAPHRKIYFYLQKKRNKTHTINKYGSILSFVYNESHSRIAYLSHGMCG
jgi:hypothetical protein